MRVLKSAQLVLGLAVGGGLMLALSGGAFAAESSVSTTSQTVAQENSSQSTPPADTNDTTSVKPKDGTTVSVSVLTTTKTTDGSGAPAATTGKANDPVVKTSDTAAATEPAKSAEAGVSAAATVPAGATPVAINQASTMASQAAPTVPVVDTAPAPAVSPEAAIALAQSLSTTEPVYHTVVLSVQPMITNTRPAAVNDLAATLPSAPTQQDPANVPAPSQPAGVFGQLTAVLAGTVVPPVFLTPLLGFAGISLAYTLLIIASILAAGRFVTSFGVWLRRGGYAHAARSDVAVATFTSFFATPFALSFVTAHSPARSSFLMVSDTKTILFVSPTLLERRK
jgi:hypothetical protein